jgi:predicted Zn-dependent protease
VKLRSAFAVCLALLPLGATAGANQQATQQPNQQAIQRYELGVARERTLDIFEAVDELTAATALDPANTGLLEHAAWLFHGYQFREEAVAAFERLLPRETDKRAVFIGLAWNEMDLGRADRSIKYFHEIYELREPPEDVGKAYLEIRARAVEENKAKIAALKKQLEDDPANVAAQRDLFQTYLYQSQWDDALPLGERLAAASRADLAFRFSYFRGLRWAGRAAEAEAQLSSLMADSPDNAFLHFERGRLLLAGNRLPEAEAALRRSLELYPGALKTRRELSEVLARGGKGEEAVALASGMVREAPASLDAQLALARAYQLGSRWDEAVAAYRQVLAGYPYNVQALSGLGESALGAGDLAVADEAAAGWELANGADPGLKRFREQVKQAAASVLLQGDSFSNNSHYRRKNAGAAGTLQAWGPVKPRFGYAYSLFQQDGFSDIERNTVFLEAETRVSASFFVDARVALNAYDDDQEHVNGKLALRASPLPGTYLSLSYSHFDIIDTEPVFGNPLYNYVASIGAVGLQITTEEYALYAQQMIGDDLMLWGNVASGAYSDDNEKLTYVLGADLRLAHEPFLHLHYSYFLLDYTDAAPTYREGDSRVAAYFSPNNFGVHTPGVELAFNLTPALRLYVADDVSYVVTSKSVTNSVACAVTFDFTKDSALRLDYRRIADIHRDGDDGEFSAEHFLISFSHRF